ncbi:MAG: hypothetical protein ACI9OJ_001940 [Myxococcota bacterium]
MVAAEFLNPTGHESSAAYTEVPPILPTGERLPVVWLPSTNSLEALQMAKPGPQTQAKRRREQAKREKREAKEEKKALRKEQKTLADSEGPPSSEANPAG